jgi:hypothetical protein
MIIIAGAIMPVSGANCKANLSDAWLKNPQEGLPGADQRKKTKLWFKRVR